MSIAISRPPDALPLAKATSSLESIGVLSVFGLLLSLALSWTIARDVWLTGAFANTDDAMRLVEVRDWLAGQGWFDLHQYRLDPPDGVQMHWTRVVDAPLALLIEAFSLVLPVESAERLTRIVYPLVLHLVFYAGVAGFARKLAGPHAMLPAVVIAALSGSVLVQFQPGRIHHHSPQVVLVVLMAWATVAAIEARTIKTAAIAAALAALSLSINVENLPYVVVEIAVFALAFVAQGRNFRAALFGFGVALAGASLAVFVATIGPSRWFVGVCDAFSTAHLFAIVLGAAAFCALAAAAPRLGSVALRLAGCAAAGVLVLGAMALVYPSCLHDPQAAVDPLLRKLWLDNVQEARPLVGLIAAQPMKFFTFALAAILGFAAVLVAAWRESGETRTRWIVLGGFVAVGLLTSLWQVRALSSASAVAVFGGAWLVARATEWAVKRADPLAKVAPFALALPFCSVFWLLVTPAEAKSDVVEGRLRCRAPAEVATLAALPKSLLLAPIDMGSDILVQTRHSVLAAPYHRNNHGNLALVNSMMAEPAAAERLVRGSGADYVVFCPAMPELEIYAAASPNGLAAALLAGRAPDWLTPEPIEGSPYKIYRVR